MSETPRTDAAQWTIPDFNPNIADVVDVDFARQLERELIATEACRLEELRAAEKLQRDNSSLKNDLRLCVDWLLSYGAVNDPNMKELLETFYETQKMLGR